MTNILLVYLTLPALALCIKNVTVQTRLGPITGEAGTLSFESSNIQYSLFKRIPFAQPPVGDLRFKEPVPFGKWQGTLDATEFGPSCIQRPRNNPSIDRLLPNMNQSEDCLYLNIYVPPNTSNTNRKSVMIWVFGGGFVIGQGMLYNATYLSVLGDVIVVTLNYRLGAFGFFSTNDEYSPGNYGLWDQKMAFQWVHDNIESFGGDPKSVTIFGESSGAFSVALHAINTDNRGLFQRVIAQSGTSNSLMTLSTVPRRSAKNFAIASNCSTELKSETMECLRNKTAAEILYAYGHMPSLTPESWNKYHFLSGIGPILDGKVVKDKPHAVLEGNNPSYEFYKSLDVVIGNCEAEGTLLVSSLWWHNVTVGISSDYLCRIIVAPLAPDFFHNNSRIVPAICTKYGSNGTMVKQSRLSVDFYGDLFFYSPTIKSLNAHARESTSSSQYQYMSTRRSSWSLRKSLTPWLPESGHASEIPFLFPVDPLAKYSTDDRRNALLMMQYWANFAKTGCVY